MRRNTPIAVPSLALVLLSTLFLVPSVAAVSLPGTTSSAVVLEVSAGGRHPCVLLSSGRVDCWGIDADQELGDGGRHNASSPHVVLRVLTATQVASSWSQTCALL